MTVRYMVIGKKNMWCIRERERERERERDAVAIIWQLEK